jgi:catechol 2,3-dioxygenase-like lactoylglutathione lyase family enzyme
MIVSLAKLYRGGQARQEEDMDDKHVSLTRIGQIAVNAHDLDRASAFYRDRLGLKEMFRVPRMAFFDCGGVRLMLDLPAREQAGRGGVIYYKVDDLQAAFETLSKRGVSVEARPHLIARMPDHELWMAFFRDPDKNAFALMAEVRS